VIGPPDFNTKSKGRLTPGTPEKHQASQNKIAKGHQLPILKKNNRPTSIQHTKSKTIDMICGCAKRQSNQKKEAAQLGRHPSSKLPKHKSE